MEAQVDPTPTKRPGRGFVVSGIVIMAVAVVGVVVVTALLGGSLDLDGFERDVVPVGPSEVSVPGQLGFRVIEDMDDPRITMTVGVVLSPDTSTVRNAATCVITDPSGEEATVRPGSESDTFSSSDISGGVSPFIVAEDLPPGEYTARCELEGEPSDLAGGKDTEVTLGVARVVTAGEVFEFAKPAFGILAAVVVGGFIGLVGLILLIVGLVIGNRARKAPPGPTGGHPPPGPGQHWGGPPDPGPGNPWSAPPR